MAFEEAFNIEIPGRSRGEDPKGQGRRRVTSRNTASPKTELPCSALPVPRRVAVTGVGLVSPLGVGNRENWERDAGRGRAALARSTRFDASRFSCRIAGEVKGFDASRFIEKKEIKKMGTSAIDYAMGARPTSRWRIRGPGGHRPANRERIAVVVGGSASGDWPVIERTQREYVNGGDNPKIISPFHHGADRQRSGGQHLHHSTA